MKKKSPKRKIIRVESEETQDHVREANDMDQEEAEEISFVPGAISVQEKPLFRCDNQCSEKTLSFRQLASRWQLESPAREYLEQVKCCKDTAQEQAEHSHDFAHQG